MTHPLIPPPELVASLRNSAPHGIRDAGVTRELWLINSSYAAGADQELEACLDQLQRWGIQGVDNLRNARRPKPPSLKEQALLALSHLVKGANESMDTTEAAEYIRRALEALSDD